MSGPTRRVEEPTGTVSCIYAPNIRVALRQRVCIGAGAYPWVWNHHSTEPQSVWNVNTRISYDRGVITRKGQATRDRIVVAAAGLMYQQGVAGTSAEDLQAAAGVSASQIYHYFGDKHALTCAVIKHWSDTIVGFHEPLLARLDDIDALRSWADVIVETARANDFRGGCPLGSLANELADCDEVARDDVVVGYRRWRGAIRDGLFAMKIRGALIEGADVDRLALALLTALQGGLLVSKALRDAEPLSTGLHTTIDHIASFATPDTA
ncbi:TetR/AcrR family transcriptional regulator [Mycolicibacterium madagascariense]|nr:TetR/AcrR family transcriptional regulator [Mycolicibacterium madagascariense]